jgi:Tfp pilus assembly protein PilN
VSQQINLFNPIFLKQEKYFSATTMAQALGLILVASVILAGYASYRLVAASREASSLSAQLAADQARLAKLSRETAAPNKDKALEDTIKLTEDEIKALRQVADVLGRGEMGNTQGYSEYFRAFARQIGGGVWLTGFHIQGAGNEIALQGRALQPDLVPAYIGRLKSEPVMQGKSFANLEINIPEAERAPKGSAAATNRPAQAMAPAGYVEFVLQSSRIIQTEQEKGR